MEFVTVCKRLCYLNDRLDFLCEARSLGQKVNTGKLSIDEEINAIEREIYSLKIEINNIVLGKNEEFPKKLCLKELLFYENRETDLEVRKKLEKERIRLETFCCVREAYNSGKNIDLFFAALKGKEPDWDKIQDYTYDELLYLLNVSKGMTESRKRANMIHEANDVSKRNIERKNWKMFLNGLNTSRVNLNKSMKRDMRLIRKQSR